MITPGPNGNVCFAESAAGKIARVTPAGLVAEFDTSASTDRGGVTFGPEGNIWFTETSANQIGRLTPGVLVLPPTALAGRAGGTRQEAVLRTVPEAHSLGGQPLASGIPRAMVDGRTLPASAPTDATAEVPAVAFSARNAQGKAVGLALSGADGTQSTVGWEAYFTALNPGDDISASFLAADNLLVPGARKALRR